ncbi:3-phosphoshikimate 1-carboxyvinyltransferase [Pseudenhygromyxa sp. WMMC2535]|uniref:3-phosphoshikimate 1-carboxyvinyltransferase n=1 Tax=Pseudenhygromyxa sp. WMMC2535 TaxID=2712867 RepID=UPI001554E22B|nr:3-phosphoshikimate 1-carboxyvinyltransferase [Pseudenhygromyxa sp. WMMC2535]
MRDPLLLRAPRGPIRATLRPPGSKSLSNRALLFAAMADGTSEVIGCLDAEDTQLMLDCLVAMGLVVTRVGSTLAEGVRVTGVGAGLGRSVGDLDLEVGTAGTVARFLTAALAAAPAPSWESVFLDGSERMRERPMGGLLEALRGLGADIGYKDAQHTLPLRIRPVAGGLPGGTVTLDRPASSQFVSALIFAGSSSREGVDIVLREGTPARPYVDMTMATLAAFGGSARWVSSGEHQGPGERLRVEPRALRPCTRFVVEPDASAASYFLALAAIYGGEVTIPDLGSESLQGDAQFWRVLAAFGAEGEQDRERTTVRGGGGGLRGQTLDLTDMPDMTLTAAVVALFAEGPTQIRGVEILRHHESDRLAAGATELRKLGAEVRELDDGLEIHPPAGGLRRGVVIDTYRDHRMAMAFALVGDVGIADPGCVAKTFPEYFEVLDGLGMIAPEPELESASQSEEGDDDAAD